MNLVQVRRSIDVPRNSLDKEEFSREMHLSEQQLEILNQNNLIISRQSKKKLNQFEAISMELYGNDQYQGQIKQLCVLYIEALTASKDRLETHQKFLIFQNEYKLQQYQKNQLETQFEKINFEIISQIFQYKIIVYSITQDEYISQIIYNKRFQKTIHLLKYDKRHYQSIQDVQIQEITEITRQIVYEIAENIQEFQRNSGQENEQSKIKAMNSDKLNYEDNSQQFLRNHKRSYSDNQKLYVDLQDEIIDKNENNLKNIQKINNFKQKKQDFSKLLDSKIDWNEFVGKNPKNSQEKSIFQSQTYHNFQTYSNFEIKPMNSSIQQQKMTQMPMLNSQINFISTEQKLNFNRFLDSNNQSPINMIDSHNQSIQSQQRELINQQIPMQNFDLFNQNLKNSSTHDEGLNHNQKIKINPQSLLQSIEFYNYSLQNKEYSKMQDSNYKSPKSNEITRNQTKSNTLQNHKKQTIISDDLNKTRYTGRLKFFDENKNYGFIIKDDDLTDIFVHYDDLKKAGMTKEFLKANNKQGFNFRFQFRCLKYIGKYQYSRKAIDIKIIPAQFYPTSF